MWFDSIDADIHRYAKFSKTEVQTHKWHLFATVSAFLGVIKAYSHQIKFDTNLNKQHYL